MKLHLHVLMIVLTGICSPEGNVLALLELHGVLELQELRARATLARLSGFGRRFRLQDMRRHASPGRTIAQHSGRRARQQIRRLCRSWRPGTKQTRSWLSVLSTYLSV